MHEAIYPSSFSSTFSKLNAVEGLLLSHLWLKTKKTEINGTYGVIEPISDRNEAVLTSVLHNTSHCNPCLTGLPLISEKKIPGVSRRFQEIFANISRRNSDRSTHIINCTHAKAWTRAMKNQIAFLGTES